MFGASELKVKKICAWNQKVGHPCFTASWKQIIRHSRILVDKSIWFRAEL